MNRNCGLSWGPWGKSHSCWVVEHTTMFMLAPAHILTCDCCSRSHALNGQSSRQSSWPRVDKKPTTWLRRVGAPWLTVYQHEWVNSLECTEWGWGNFLERKWGAISMNGDQKKQQMSTSPPPYANIFDFNPSLLKTDWLPWKGRKGSFALIIKKRAPSHKTSQHWKVTRCLYVHFLLGNYYSPVSQMRKGRQGRKKCCRRSSAKQEYCRVPRNSFQIPSPDPRRLSQWPSPVDRRIHGCLWRAPHYPWHIFSKHTAPWGV